MLTAKSSDLFFLKFYLDQIKKWTIQMGENGLHIWTDGSSLRNGKPDSKAGFAFIVKEKDKLICQIAQPLPRGTTNQTAELKAIEAALQFCFAVVRSTAQRRCVTLYTDSMYCIQCCTDWIKMWRKKKCTDKVHFVLVDKIVSDIEELEKNNMHIKFHHVCAHTNIPENDLVDSLAKQAANMST